MTITNKSGVSLIVNDKIITPGQTREYPRRFDSCLKLRSELGCYTLSVKEERVVFEGDGKLKIKLGMKKDRNGVRNVNIYAAN